MPLDTLSALEAMMVNWNDIKVSNIWAFHCNVLHRNLDLTHASILDIDICQEYFVFTFYLSINKGGWGIFFRIKYVTFSIYWIPSNLLLYNSKLPSNFSARNSKLNFYDYGSLVVAAQHFSRREGSKASVQSREVRSEGERSRKNISGGAVKIF